MTADSSKTTWPLIKGHIDDTVARLAIRATADFHSALEKACEQSLQGGQHGVLVEWAEGGMSWSISVSAVVPYGHIYEVKPWL